MRGTRPSTVLVGMTVVALIAAGCGGAKPGAAESSTTTPAADSTPAGAQQIAQFGTSVDIAAPSGTASYTVDNLRPVPPDAQIIPATGTMFAVDVTIRAKTGTTAYNGFYFVARTADGSTIAPAVGAVRPGITSGQLPQGQQIAGHVAYDVPQGQSISAIAFRDPQGKTLAVWAG